MKKLSIVLLSLLAFFSINSAIAEDESQVTFSDAELEQMLAPIALYPDSVLTHILIASTYPLEVIQANRWVKRNAELSAAEALSGVEDKDWDPSVKALIPFPKILERLSDDLDWAQKLGDAFLQDEARVLSSIQSLRHKADQAGNLDKMEHMQVTREDDNIIIQPVRREVVYVPYYDPRVVYGPWYWNQYPPVYWDSHYAYHGAYYWYPSVHINHNFYFSAFHWHNHHIIVMDHGHYDSRRHYHRDHIIRSNNARQWNHNPNHRRGVAYRSEPVRQRYNSNRTSTIETRVTRRNESEILNNRNSQVNRNSANNANNRNVAPARTNTTRQEQLRQRLDSGEQRDDRARSNTDIKQPRNSNNPARTRQTDRDQNTDNSKQPTVDQKSPQNRAPQSRPPQRTNDKKDNQQRSEPSNRDVKPPQAADVRRQPPPKRESSERADDNRNRQDNHRSERKRESRAVKSSNSNRNRESSSKNRADNSSRRKER